MNPDGSRPSGASRTPATRPAAAGRGRRRLGRCPCGARRGPARRLRVDPSRTVLSGMVWLGLCNVGVTREMTDAALRWCDGVGHPALPCCTDALPEGFRPDALPGV
jgi:hypothetical protein